MHVNTAIVHLARLHTGKPPRSELGFLVIQIPGRGANSAVSWEGCPVASPAFPAPRAWLSFSHLHSQCLMLCRAGSEFRSAGRPTSLSSPIRPLLPGSPGPPSRGGGPSCHAVMLTRFLGAGPHLRASEQHWTPGNTWPVVSRLINLRKWL